MRKKKNVKNPLLVVNKKKTLVLKPLNSTDDMSKSTTLSEKTTCTTNIINEKKNEQKLCNKNELNVKIPLSSQKKSVFFLVFFFLFIDFLFFGLFISTMWYYNLTIDEFIFELTQNISDLLNSINELQHQNIDRYIKDFDTFSQNVEESQKHVDSLNSRLENYENSRKVFKDKNTYFTTNTKGVFLFLSVCSVLVFLRHH